MSLLHIAKLSAAFLLLKDMGFSLNLHVLNRTGFRAELSSLNNWDLYSHYKKIENKEGDVILSIPKHEVTSVFLKLSNEGNALDTSKLTLSLSKGSFWQKKVSFDVNVAKVWNSLELNLTDADNNVVDILRGHHGTSLLLYIDNKRFSYYLVLFETKNGYGNLPEYDRTY